MITLINLVIKYLELFLIGTYYSLYNFIISFLDLFIIPYQLTKSEKLISLLKKYLKFTLIKLLVFYQYLLLPGRWITYLETRKYKLPNSQNYTYGETPYLTSFQILQDLFSTIKKEDYIFIDLGCGTGKNVFISSVFFDLQSIGIDNIKTFINKANQISTLLFKNQQTQFIKSDILEFLNSPSNKEKLQHKKIIFYIAATAFEETFFYEIINKILDSYPHSVIITISKAISKKNINSKNTVFNLMKKNYYFGWGKSSVFFYLTICYLQ